MEPPPANAAKICIVCGKDCSKVPRLRDERGRYTCKACATPAAEAPAPPVPAAQAEATRAELKSAAEPVRLDDTPYELEPIEAAAPAPAVPTRSGARRAESTRAEPCPACSTRMPAGSIICINCGFDRRKGFQKGTGAGASRRHGGEVACPGCGYDLRGLTTPKCPECGEVISPEGIRRKRRERDDRRLYIKAYASPIFLLVFGGGIAVWRALALGASLEMLAIMFAIELVLSLAIYAMFAFWWIGFASSLHLSALQLAACLACMEAARMTASGVLQGIPIGIMGTIVVYGFIMFATALLMAKVMDMDMEEASIVCTGIALVAFFVPPVLHLMGWM
ncbi:MAG: hypothetical protein AB7K52_14700 [Phycisphaerales bacterium]